MIPEIFVKYATDLNANVLSKKGQFLGNLRLSNSGKNVYRCLGTIYENSSEGPIMIDNPYLLPGEFRTDEPT